MDVKLSETSTLAFHQNKKNKVWMVCGNSPPLPQNTKIVYGLYVLRSYLPRISLKHKK